MIRIALVKLSKSYSRISLSEIASILQLDSAEEACYTCMRVGVEEARNGKNIRDGIIQGRIEGDYFVTEEVVGMIERCEGRTVQRLRRCRRSSSARKLRSA